MENKNIDFREKRLNIVFKVIYVLAAFFAVLFLDVGNQFGDGLSFSYIFEVELVTILLMIMMAIVSYIFSELRCLKFGVSDDSDFERTETSYSNIFDNIGIISIIVSVISIVLFIFHTKLNENFFLVVFAVSTVLCIVGYFLRKKQFINRMFFKVLRLIIAIFSINSAFFYLGC